MVRNRDFNTDDSVNQGDIPRNVAREGWRRIPIVPGQHFGRKAVLLQRAAFEQQVFKAAGNAVGA